MQKNYFTLPEFAFLDSQCHQEDNLKFRTVFIHIRTATIIEAICIDEIMDIALNCKKHSFTYKNSNGFTESHVLALHYSFAADSEIENIFKKAAQWYCAYMAWEDANIDEDEISKQN